METRPAPRSPRWTTTTKLVVALTLVAVAAGLIIRFQSLLAPLLLAFILTYLLHPLVSALARGTRLSWGLSTALIFLLLVAALLSLLTLGGVGLFGQIESLIRLVQAALDELPALLIDLSNWNWEFGPFHLNLGSLDLANVTDQLLGLAQSLLGQTGSLISTVAGGALETFGWAAFVLLISYFVLAESGGLRDRILSFNVPGYAEDLGRLGRELGRIWDAFLRGQVLLFLLTFVIYTLVLSVLGVRYAIGIALLAGLARFLPYIGPAITWIVLALVTFFQAYKPFGLSPLAYTIIMVVIGLVIDQLFDNFISPRVMAQTLRVHPAAVLLAALIAANLLGVVGVLLAAPMLATLKLLFQYTQRKMFDQDPWPDPEPEPPVRKPPGLPGWLKKRLPGRRKDPPKNG